MGGFGALAESTGFLFSYGAMMIVALVASFILGRRFRAAGHKRVIDDPDTLALLARDGSRFVDVVLTRLLARKAISLTPYSKFAIAADGKAGSKGETVIERRVLSLPDPFKWEAAARVIKGEAEAMVRPLVDQGLLADPQQLQRRRMAQVAPLLMLLAPATIFWLVAWSSGVSAMVLAFLVGLTGLLIVIRWTGTDRRTTGGVDTVIAAAAQYDRLKRGAPRDELAMGVALFGTSILAGSALSAYHKMRASSDSGGDAGAGGDSGGGCGGGGCS